MVRAPISCGISRVISKLHSCKSKGHFLYPVVSGSVDNRLQRLLVGGDFLLNGTALRLNLRPLLLQQLLLFLQLLP